MRRNDPFAGLLNDFLSNDWQGGSLMKNVGHSIVPPVNIREEEDSYLVELAAPGKAKDDFEIKLDKDTLIISSTSKEEKSESDEKIAYSRKEFNYSSFKRVFNLPESADMDNIHAVYEAGVLKVSIPKKEEAKPKPVRTIDIQ